MDLNFLSNVLFTCLWTGEPNIYSFVRGHMPPGRVKNVRIFPSARGDMWPVDSFVSSGWTINGVINFNTNINLCAPHRCCLFANQHQWTAPFRETFVFASFQLSTGKMNWQWIYFRLLRTRWKRRSPLEYLFTNGSDGSHEARMLLLFVIVFT